MVLVFLSIFVSCCLFEVHLDLLDRLSRPMAMNDLRGSLFAELLDRLVSVARGVSASGQLGATIIIRCSVPAFRVKHVCQSG